MMMTEEFDGEVSIGNNLLFKLSYACTTSTSTNRNKMCMQSYWSVFISFHINLLRQPSKTAGPVQNTKRILTHIVVY